MALRGVRGASTVESNNLPDILNETEALLGALLDKNACNKDDIASIFFSVTKDLDATFPAKAARKMGLLYTPLLCLNEIDVPNSLQKCIRILIHINTDKSQKDMIPIYLKGADVLRPDVGDNRD